MTLGMSAVPQSLRDLYVIAKAQGWDVTRPAKSIKWTGPDGQIVFTGHGNHHDSEVVARRRLRNAGLKL